MDDPSTRRAAFIADADLPAGSYDLFAICRGSLDDIPRRTGVPVQHRRIPKSEGGPCRALAVSLPSGRHAQLRTYDRLRDQLEIYMQTVDDWNSCRADLKDICRLIDVRLQNLVWSATKAQLRTMRTDENDGVRIKVPAAS